MSLLRKYKTIALVSTIMLFSFVFGVYSAFAYNIGHDGGFSPTPTVVRPLSTFAAETKTALSNAASAWNGVGLGTLVTRGTDTSNTTYPNDNDINEVTKGYRGTNTYLMQATYVTQEYVWKDNNLYWCNTEVDIDVNISYPWSTTGTSTAYDLQSVFTHELGHLLGLSHSNVSDATMWPTISKGDTSWRTLATDDINGITAIHW
ncbi:matrixin family metalloprotease [Paenibacillus caui]|uniref:matrixin family metalloprotease n=1 Tax=Paenibacillus caui TaxID=2873927 RepID=UPI001CA94F3E|nr:matrixin family metalloprotease [Paenibacillus caui]